MGTYVADKYVKGMMNSTGCSVEEAIASTNKDPNNVYNTGMPDNDYIEEALDLQFKKYHDAYKNRNLRFYKLLGQNYESLVNGIFRGKDIVYKIPKRYEMNTKHPFVLDWLLLYGRPAQIASVRQMGPVKLNAIYNALVAWCDQNPSEAKNWVYEKEWRDYFSASKPKKRSDDILDTPKQGRLHKYTPSPKIEKEGEEIKEVSNNKEEHTVEVKEMLPELQFLRKRCKTGMTRKDHGDVGISFSIKKVKGENHNDLEIMTISLRASAEEKIKGEYISVAALKNRIYFKTVDNSVDGFKLTAKSKCRYATITMTPEIKKTFAPFAGKSFDIKYDDLYELYYGEVE